MIDVSARRTNFVVPTLIAAVVLPLALVLLVVGARSPFTHMNLSASYDPNYTRTAQGVVGPPGMMDTMRLGVVPAQDPVERGHQLFVADGCASCHGIDGHGGIIGPPIAGTSASRLRAKTKEGPGGMPAFAPDMLPDADLNAIAAYLKTQTH